MKRRLLLGVVILLAVGQGTGLRGQCRGDCTDGQCGNEIRCSACGCLCSPAAVVMKTVLVPTLVAETRIEYSIETKTEEREVPYTVFQRVPVKREFKSEKCYLAEEVKTKVVTWKECRRVENPVVRTYTTCVPETETREGVRRYCVDAAAAESGALTGCPTSCDPCRHGGMCPADGKVLVEEPCTYDVTVMRPQVCSQTDSVPDVVFETKSDVISYCVKTPKKTSQVCGEETVYKLQPVEKTRKVTVCVPVKVPRPVEVTVCKMVPHTVVCCQSCGQKKHCR